MRKYIFLSLCLLGTLFVFSTASGNNINPVVRKTVNVAKAGTLSSLLTESEKKSITDLTVTGRLNGTDIVVLQNMANESMTALDMGGVYIVAGGSVYYTFTTPIGSTDYSTKDNVVGAYMFHDCTVLKKVVLPRAATTIESAAFGYSSLKSMTIGSKVTSITAGLCAGTPLDEIILEGNTSFILQDGILYDKVKTTVYKALCTITGDIVLPGSVAVIQNSSFSECQMRSVVIPDKVEEIETAAFSDCANLEEVRFPVSLTKVGYSSFSWCKNLKSVDLSHTKVTQIASNAFYYCSSIQTVLLPSSLKEISGSVFTSAVLRKISCAATTPPTIEEGTYPTFNYTQIANKCTLYINRRYENAYRKAIGWRKFFNVNEIGREADVSNSDDLQDFINSLAGSDDKGTEEDPKKIPVSPDGMDVDTDVNVSDDLQLFIDGAGNNGGGSVAVKFTRGLINISNEACGWQFRNVIFSDGNSASAQNDETRAASAVITKSKGISNRGRLVLGSSVVSEGGYEFSNLSAGSLVLKEGTNVNGASNIINSGKVYTDGSCDVKNLQNKCGGRIYLTGMLTKPIHITVKDVADIETGVPVVAGADGYVLSENDTRLITITLPEGYDWRYDAVLRAVVISVASGISLPDAELPAIRSTYDASGRNAVHSNGLSIRVMSDGTVRKVVVK